MLGRQPRWPRRIRNFGTKKPHIVTAVRRPPPPDPLNCTPSTGPTGFWGRPIKTQPKALVTTASVAAIRSRRRVETGCRSYIQSRPGGGAKVLQHGHLVFSGFRLHQLTIPFSRTWLAAPRDQSRLLCQRRTTPANRRRLAALPVYTPPPPRCRRRSKAAHHRGFAVR